MGEDRENRNNDGRQEVDAAFAAFAREAGFRVRGSRAWRQREGVQDGLRLSRSRTGWEQSIDLLVRLERPGDRGSKVLRSYDIEASLDSLLGSRGYLGSKEDRAFYLAAIRLGPPPSEGRGPVVRRLLEASLLWFDEIGSVASLRRYIAAGKDRTHMGLVTRAFFEDYVWKTP